MQDGGRQERLHRGAKQEVTQPVPTSTAAGVSGRVIGIIRSIDYEKGVLRWQRIRYKDKVPVVGRYEAYGKIEDGYPLETEPLDFCGHWVFGPGEITHLAIPIFASKRWGVWIIERYMKVDPSVLDPSAVVPGCGQG